MKKMLAVALLVGCVGCIGGGKPASAVCEVTSDCDDGLTCEPFAVFQQNVCMEQGLMCTTTCETDADCAPLGASFKCFANYDGKVCGDTAAP